MKSLLIVAHGSRRHNSNEEVKQLAECVARRPDTGFDDVSAAFLEIAEPSIPEGLEACIVRGAKEVVVFPYFLAAGRHVVEDIPEEIKPVTDKYPHIPVRIAPHLGLATALPEIIVDTARQTSD
ncbi:MAG: CbiX/SirB N-terminal domain-containing protein [Gammaproteobacteria bacterium]|jgi:sirohydrochlorin ferrochelatase